MHTINTNKIARKSRILDLYGQGYDFPRSHTTPRVEYMLAALPRSGSTHLATELWRTGVMGSPMEYPNHPFRNAMIREHPDIGSGLNIYWRAVQQIRTSPNGVFGFKMFMSDYMYFAKNNAELLPLIAPDKVIFITRANIVEQAISYSKAIRTGKWFGCAKELEKAPYDKVHIQSCIAALQHQIDFWNDLFELTQTETHHVIYEGLLANPNGIVNGVADFLGVKLDPNTVVDLPRMQIQRNEESAEWARRYLEESDEAMGHKK